MTLRITLIRHGNTDANNEKWLQGQVDTQLNKSGLTQAKSCGERLKNEHFDHVYCSDLTRCKQTILAIMFHHCDLSIEYTDQLRERDFGKLSRQHWTYLASETNKQHISVDQLISDNGGESQLTFRKRVAKVYESIVKDAQVKQYQSILVCSHGGPLGYLVSHWLENGFKVIDGLVVTPGKQGNTAVTRIAVNDDGDNYFEEFNSTSHLKDRNQPAPLAI